MTITRRAVIKALIVLATVAALLGGSAAACDTNTETQQRRESAKQTAAKDSLEKRNLRAKIKLDEDANRVGYVYLVTFGKPIGFYAIKGKVSSNGSQVDPENLVECPYSCSAPVVIDGPQDDGSYGEGDPGIFFFTTEGTMVVTSMDYLYSTSPLPNSLDLPKLN